MQNRNLKCLKSELRKIKMATEIPRGKYIIMQALESQNKMVQNVSFMVKMK